MDDLSYKKLVRNFGIYHAIAIAPLILPIISEKVLSRIGIVHSHFQLPGNWIVFDVSEMMFINLFSSVAFIWALVRIRHPSRILGVYEGWGMLLMSLIVIYYVNHGASALWLVIPLVDIPGGILHIYHYANFKSNSSRK